MGSTPVGSIDALVALEPAALGDEALRAMLVDLERARAVLEAVGAAAVVELDRRRAFEHDGAVNARSWLAHQTGVARAVAGGRVRLAKRLRHMPAMHAALAAGTVTEGHARALARALTPRTVEAFLRDEPALVAHAVELEVDDFERLVTRWLALADQDGPEPGLGTASELRASRHWEGRVRIDGDLDVEDGAEFLAELEAISDELWREEREDAPDTAMLRRAKAERDAAALVEMARRSSATRRQDLDDDGSDPGVARRPRRPELVVRVDVEALAGVPGAMVELDDGTLIPQSVLQRWLCDCGKSTVVAKDGVPFDLTRVAYTPTAGQRRILGERDRGCVVRTCRRKPRWCDAHHVVPWPAGPTRLENLVLLCKRHHKLVHHGVIRLVADGPQRWKVVRRDGTPILGRPPPELAA